jgi:hypothetical protein
MYAAGGRLLFPDQALLLKAHTRALAIDALPMMRHGASISLFRFDSDGQPLFGEADGPGRRIWNALAGLGSERVSLLGGRPGSTTLVIAKDIDELVAAASAAQEEFGRARRSYSDEIEVVASDSDDVEFNEDISYSPRPSLRQIAKDHFEPLLRTVAISGEEHPMSVRALVDSAMADLWRHQAQRAYQAVLDRFEEVLAPAARQLGIQPRSDGLRDSVFGLSHTLLSSYQLENEDTRRLGFTWQYRVPMTELNQAIRAYYDGVDRGALGLLSRLGGRLTLERLNKHESALRAGADPSVDAWREALGREESCGLHALTLPMSLLQPGTPGSPDYILGDSALVSVDEDDRPDFKLRTQAIIDAYRGRVLATLSEDAKAVLSRASIQHVAALCWPMTLQVSASSSGIAEAYDEFEQNLEAYAQQVSGFLNDYVRQEAEARNGLDKVALPPFVLSRVGIGGVKPLFQGLLPEMPVASALGRPDNPVTIALDQGRTNTVNLCRAVVALNRAGVSVTRLQRLLKEQISVFVDAGGTPYSPETVMELYRTRGIARNAELALINGIQSDEGSFVGTERSAAVPSGYEARERIASMVQTRLHELADENYVELDGRRWTIRTATPFAVGPQGRLGQSDETSGPAAVLQQMERELGKGVARKQRRFRQYTQRELERMKPKKLPSKAAALRSAATAIPAHPFFGFDGHSDSAARMTLALVPVPGKRGLVDPKATPLLRALSVEQCSNPARWRPIQVTGMRRLVGPARGPGGFNLTLHHVSLQDLGRSIAPVANILTEDGWEGALETQVEALRGRLLSKLESLKQHSGKPPQQYLDWSLRRFLENPAYAEIRINEACDRLRMTEKDFSLESIKVEAAKSDYEHI